MNLPPRKRISLSSLSDERRDLILCMHERQFGTISDLPVVNGEPILKKAKIVRQHNLTVQATPKAVSQNFILKDIHLRLLALLDRIENGKLEQITFRDGLPHLLHECETN